MNKRSKQKQHPWLESPIAVDEFFNELLATCGDENVNVEIRCVPLTNAVWRDDSRKFVDACGDTFDASIMGMLAVGEPLIGTIVDGCDEDGDRWVNLETDSGNIISLDRQRIVAMRRGVGPVKLNFKYPGEYAGDLDIELKSDGTAVIDGDSDFTLSRKDLRKLYDALGEHLDA